MTTKQRKMLDLVESCGGFAEAVALLAHSFETTFADAGEETPAELAPCLAALETLQSAAQTLDVACS